MKYKQGDRVRIKSLDWYNENKDSSGEVVGAFFDARKSKFCGTIQTITNNGTLMGSGIVIYAIEDACEFIGEEAIEGLVEEENKNMDEELRKCKSDFKHWVDNYIILPDGYVFKDENGNLIYGKKIILEKNKKSYPKTYEECCAILGYQCNWLMSTAKPGDTNKITENELLFEYLIIQFKKLLICRDAYWKIAGEEMGLGKPWKPRYELLNCMIVRNQYKDTIYCLNVHGSGYTLLTFPTKEMRDAFYENFKELIEICKELL